MSSLDHIYFTRGRTSEARGRNECNASKQNIKTSSNLRTSGFRPLTSDSWNGGIFMFKPKGRARFPWLRHKKRPRRPLDFRQMFVISFIVFILLTVGALWLINRGLEPILIDIAKTKTENIATRVINYSVNKQIKQSRENQSYLKTVGSGDNMAYIIDSGYLMQVSSTATLRAQNALRMIEEGKSEELVIPGVEITQDKEQSGLIYNMPLGQATNNALLSNLGPQIPVRFAVVGNLTSTIKETTDTVGINTVHYNAILHVEAEVRTVVPFATKPKRVSTNITIANTFIKGGVPLYYGGGNGNNPSVVLPNNKQKGQTRETKVQ